MVEELNNPTSWLHGQVVGALGDKYCYDTWSKSRDQVYEIIATETMELWTIVEKKNQYSNSARKALTSLLQAAKSPLECRAWLVPVLEGFHWYLLVLDWFTCTIGICDSYGFRKGPDSHLSRLGRALVMYAQQDLVLDISDTWSTVSEQVGHQIGSVCV
jgi:hypothetical protein